MSWVKGASEPVRVFQLTGVGAMKTRFDRSRAAGLRRFVGRVGDMQTAGSGPRAGARRKPARLLEAEAKLAGREGDAGALRSGLEAAEREYREIGADAHADRVAAERSSAD